MTPARRLEIIPVPPATDVEAERWWWDEIGVLVEHEVWHLPRLADEQDGAE
jgi:hypothetical protein